ncbi:DUF6248 family natural product biosynthesis protein [Streptomyces tauricus]|uniref:DUF6248 family natural product biosynthesis protein n=1 Tax=Streptomyces tauricus TaxID=68274 RepID=UPI0022448C91|nr:DUF6248 family natural product biosynthesis protein [Streptomyces tauricus]MCW8102693.1 DUF1643 domain-containing protein [Streptomyces tauricus]
MTPNQPALFEPERASGISRSAVLSDCGHYRYRLERGGLPPLNENGRESDPDRTATFVMLNPSTATADTDDPTVRRCIDYARRWGCGRLLVVNLYAWRATKPAALWAAEDPVAPENDDYLAAAASAAAQRSEPLVAAWGANATPERAAAVLRLPGMDRLTALAFTKERQPRHPLYLAAELVPQPWRRPHPAGRPAVADATGGASMTPEQAAWVRAYAWRPSWLRHYQEMPGPFTHCACQRPPSVECQMGHHGTCRHDGHPINEAVIATNRGRAARFPDPYEHRTPAGRHGKRLAYGTNDAAWVWLVGVPCREVCNCGCHRPGPPA